MKVRELVQSLRTAGFIEEPKICKGSHHCFYKTFGSENKPQKLKTGLSYHNLSHEAKPYQIKSVNHAIAEVQQIINNQ